MGSYLEDREAEEERKAGGAGQGGSDLPDLSALQPKPLTRPAPELHEAAVLVGHRQGFDRPVGAEPKPKPSRAPAARRQRGVAPAEGPTKRNIISLQGERPEAGVQGQIALTGSALTLWEFIRRAHFERRPRGELLQDMLALWEEKHGKTPEIF